MNKLIVESKNDKAFVEALVKHINAHAEINEILSSVDEIEELGVGLSEMRLTQKIEDVLDEVRKKGVDKIGILIDLDTKTFQERFDLVNNCLKIALKNKGFNENTEGVAAINTFLNIEIDDSTTVELACHFTNVDGQGELETVLKRIKNQESTFADCLNQWRLCLTENQKNISDKEFDKFWVSNYIRFDTCSNQDRTQAGRKCSMQNFDYVLENKENIFDFNHNSLDEMRTFLNLFK